MQQIKTISIVIPYNRKDGLSLWFQKRSSSDELNGMSEFPGGKIEFNETPIVAAVREFKEEVGMDITEKQLNLIKIHNHSSLENFIFYIFGLEINKESLPINGWSSIIDKDLGSCGLSIPSENYIFMKDILKNL